MRLKPFPAVALLLSLLLAGCQPDYTAALSCKGPAQPATPSSTYAGRTLADLESLASVGDLGAARVLGERYQHGEGVPIDLKQAARWYEQAALVPPRTVPVYIPGFGKTPPTVTEVAVGPVVPGDSIALVELGTLYAKGEGVVQDRDRAKRLKDCAILRAANDDGMTPTDDQVSPKQGR